MMAQARKEPRFADMELLAPVKLAGASARLSIVDADISDAVFETVRSSDTNTAPMEEQPSISARTAPSLGLLKQSVPFDTASFASGDQLSPGFLGITLILAFAAFWLCGGHALLY
jgi:hypothetical protein